MPQLQDVFWTGFADEVEKLSGIAGKLGKGALIAAGVGGAAALASSGKKGVENAKTKAEAANTTMNSRFSRQTGEDY